MAREIRHAHSSAVHGLNDDIEHVFASSLYHLMVCMYPFFSRVYNIHLVEYRTLRIQASVFVKH
jgi:hypothetical protein